MATHSHQEPVPTKVCLRCGVQSRTGADRCPSCGKPYRRRNWLLWGVLTLVLFVLFLTVLAFIALTPG